MTTRHYRHVPPERVEVLQYIHRRYNTLRLLKSRTGLPERRLQRRVSELLELGLIEQVGRYTEVSVSLRIFALTEEGRRNVPSKLEGSTVRG